MKVLKPNEVSEIMKSENPIFNEYGIKNFSFKGYEFNDVDIVFSRCMIVNCDFTESNLSHLKFDSCHFIGCDFSKSEGYLTQFHECCFERCHFSNIQYEMTHFFHCIFRICTFVNGTLYKSQFVQSLFQLKTVFDNINIDKVIFDNSNKNEHNGQVEFICNHRNVQYINSNLEPNYTINDNLISVMKKVAARHEEE